MIPWDSLTIGYLIFEDSQVNKFGGFAKFIFHVFDRYEIQTQAFVDFINGKLIIFNPHLRKI